MMTKNTITHGGGGAKSQQNPHFVQIFVEGIKKNLPKQKQGFTLAETLITLAIIGVVAALTVPTVVANYQKKQYIARFKKTYSVLNNAMYRAVIDYGSNKNWGDGIYGTAGILAENFTKKYVRPYLKISKSCAHNYNSDCMWKYKSGKNSTTEQDNRNQANNAGDAFYLADGTFVTFENEAGQFGIYVDVNGPKKPNTLGWDMFALYYDRSDTKPAIEAVGINSSNTAFKKQCTSTNGSKCSGLIMKNGWRIPTKDEYVNNYGCTSEKYPW